MINTQIKVNISDDLLQRNLFYLYLLLLIAFVLIIVKRILIFYMLYILSLFIFLKFSP